MWQRSGEKKNRRDREKKGHPWPCIYTYTQFFPFPSQACWTFPLCFYARPLLFCFFLCVRLNVMQQQPKVTYSLYNLEHPVSDPVGDSYLIPNSCWELAILIRVAFLGKQSDTLRSGYPRWYKYLYNTIIIAHRDDWFIQFSKQSGFLRYLARISTWLIDFFPREGFSPVILRLKKIK